MSRICVTPAKKYLHVIEVVIEPFWKNTFFVVQEKICV